jgi:two-component system LytT family response regulator
MPFTCLIVDDEPASRVVLRELLHRFCPQMVVAGEAGNVNDAEAAIAALQPDLLFLDIQMPGNDGFDLLRRFPDPDFAIIFITSYNQFAIKAIRFNALDYLLKPVDIDELMQAVERFAKNKMHPISAAIAENMLAFDAKIPKLAFHSRDKVILVPVHELVYLEASSNYTIAHRKSGEPLIYTRSLLEMAQLLADHPEFLRISKGLIVNSNCIVSYGKREPYFVALSTGQEFEISRRRRTELLQRLNTLSFRNEA